MPITSQPSRNARMVTARMAGFKPGTSPPPVRIPITPFFVFHVSTLCVARCQIVPAQIPSVLTRSTLWGILRKMVNFEQTKHTLAVYFVDQARFLPDGCFNPHASPGRGSRHWFRTFFQRSSRNILLPGPFSCVCQG